LAPQGARLAARGPVVLQFPAQFIGAGFGLAFQDSEAYSFS